MHVYLLRHAHAEYAANDAERPLSAKGHRQLHRLAYGLRDYSFPASLALWSSLLVRADETVNCLKKSLELDAPIERKKGLTPFDNPSRIAEEINVSERSILLAGHEPNLSSLASLLLCGGDDFERVVFAKASMLCLSRLKAGSNATPWQIEWHISHKFFKQAK